jgi:hypothetical protein
MTDDNFFSRWSRKKHEAKRGAVEEQAPPAVPAANAMPVETALQPEATAPVLPPVESLTPESDFTPFMKSEVDPGVRREALRTLFADPRHNVMDGLDVYIDDYSKPDPLPPEWLAKMNVMKHLGHMVEEPQADAEPSGEPGSALKNSMEEQPVAQQPADTASDDLPQVSVTESPKSGGTLPRNEA